MSPPDPALPRPPRPPADLAITLVSLLLAALALLTLAPHLPHAELWYYDEWYTAERTKTILARNDWLTLYENGTPVFKKPPLQYWASAALIRAGLPELLALRLPSYLAAFAVMALVADLARRLSGRALAVPLALALLLSSPMFWQSSGSAMLDILATFWLTLSLAALLRAWNSPRWWWIVALAIGLGALQKAPVAAFAVPFAALALRLSGARLHPPGRHALALVLALALMLAWPLTQVLLHGSASVGTTLLREQLLRFQPAAQDWGRTFRWLFWAIGDGAALWGGLILGAAALPLLRPAPQTRMAAALVLAFFLALTAARGEIFDRYLLQILPLAAAATGAALACLPRGIGLLGALALSITSGGPLKSATDADLTRPGMAPYRPLLAGFRAALRPAEQPIVCGWGKSDLVIFPGALWLLASGDAPFRRVWSPDDLAEAIRTGNIRLPLRGLCLQEEYTALAARLPVKTVTADAGWVHWTLP